MAGVLMGHLCWFCLIHFSGENYIFIVAAAFSIGMQPGPLISMVHRFALYRCFGFDLRQLGNVFIVHRLKKESEKDHASPL